MKKSHIILLVSILAIFAISMIAIIINKNKNIEETDPAYHNYATQTTATPTTESVNETYEIEKGGYNYEHVERLTFAQQAVRVKLDQLIANDFIEEYHLGDTIVNVTISELSTEDIVYVNFTFKDKDGIEFQDTAVVIYDTYSQNTFVRCLSINDYNAIYQN